MAKKGLDFKHKEVINITDGRRLGTVIDLEADLESGKINSIIVPGESKRFGFVSRDNEIIIPCGNITKVCKYYKPI